MPKGKKSYTKTSKKQGSKFLTSKQYSHFKALMRGDATLDSEE